MSHPERAEPVPTVTQRVVSAIEAMVSDGTLAPGDHVSEPFVAKATGVSRGPVREACRALVERGVLVAHTNRGCFVRRLSVRDVADLYDVRAALARLAGQTLARCITPEQQAALSEIVAAHEDAAQRWDLPAMRSLNLAFHERIVVDGGNRRLQAFEASMAKELALFRGSTRATEDRNREHRAILEALLARDADAAGQAMEAHILASKMRFLQTLPPD